MQYVDKCQYLFIIYNSLIFEIICYILSFISLPQSCYQNWGSCTYFSKIQFSKTPKWKFLAKIQKRLFCRALIFYFIKNYMLKIVTKVSNKWLIDKSSLFINHECTCPLGDWGGHTSLPEYNPWGHFLTGSLGNYHSY